MIIMGILLLKQFQDKDGIISEVEQVMQQLGIHTLIMIILL